MLSQTQTCCCHYNQWDGICQLSKAQQEITVGIIQDAAVCLNCIVTRVVLDEKSLNTISEVVIQDTFMLGYVKRESSEDADFCLPHTKFKADYILLMMKQLYAICRKFGPIKIVLCSRELNGPRSSLA